MAERIYLEYAPVLGSSYGHLYLVKREEITDPNDWTQFGSGEVIRGGASNPFNDLEIEAGETLQSSADKYKGPGDLQTRGYVDITDLITGGISAWSSMVSFANGIKNRYDYDTPTETDEHVANSNSTILSVLNFLNINVRSFLSNQFQSSGLDFFGAANYGTLIGSDHTSNVIEASDSMMSDSITLLGRDSVDDILIGTQVGNIFYGEQEEDHNKTNDTVSYVKSDAAVEIINTVVSGPGASEVNGSGLGGHAEQDVFYGIENFIGSDFNDQFKMSGEQNNILTGGKGNDILIGGKGDSTLTVVGDTLFGNEGDDILYGGDQNAWSDETPDYLYGGEGNDTYYVGATGAEDANGDAGYEEARRITVYPFTNFNNSIYDYIDIISDDDGSGTIHAQLTGMAAVGLDISPTQITGNWEKDSFLVGGLENYIGSINFQPIWAVVHPYATPNGSAVHRIVFYEPELYTALFAIENFKNGDFGITLEGYTPPDIGNNIEGTPSDDNIPGTVDNDIIKGKAGNDTIDGDAGDDVIYGDAGDDALTGGEGDDVLNGGEGADSLDGGNGIDTVSYKGATVGVYAHLLDVYQGTGDALGDTFTSIENIIGSYYDDTFIATNENNVVRGDLGDDTINGLAGDDTIYGEEGDDTIYGDEGDDTLIGGKGDDIVFGYEDNDTLILGDGDDYAIGGTGNDTVTGEDGEDEIYGHEGNDILIGGADDDLLFGDEGDDLIDVGTGDDFAVGGTGNDTFVFRADFGGNIISDFEAGAGASDVIEFESSSGLTSYSEVQAIMTEWQGTTYIELDANNYITLTDVAMSSLDQDDFRFVA